MGITMSTAINIFLKQVIINNGIPFQVTIPEEKKQ
jgi:addiction module RelB/DinJ family antitoxin